MKKPDERYEQLAQRAMNLRASIAHATAELLKVESGIDQYFGPDEIGCASCEYAEVTRQIVPRFSIQTDTVQMLCSTGTPDIHKIQEGIKVERVRVFSYMPLKPFPTMPKEIAHV